MEQEVSKWLQTQLAYNSAADSTISANVRGNLKGLWEFLIANYKTAESKRHIQHVLARHRQEQEAARLAPEQQKQALAQRQHLRQLHKKASDLEQTLASYQARVEAHGQEAVDQGSERALLQQELSNVQCQALLLHMFVHRAHKLLQELQQKLSQLRAALDIANARRQAAGANKRLQAVKQQLAQLSSSIRQGLEEVVDEKQLQQLGLLTADLHPMQDQQQPQQQHVQDIYCDQQLQPATAAAAIVAGRNISNELYGGLFQMSGVAAAAAGLQQPLQRCSLFSSFRLSDEAKSGAMQLLQEGPAVLWTASTQLALQAANELSALLEDTERDVLAPVSWPVSAAPAQGGAVNGQQQQQQLSCAVVSTSGSCSSRLPWATGLSTTIAAAYDGQGIPPPAEIRVRTRQLQHMHLFVQARGAASKAKRAMQELHLVLGSTPLLRAAAAADAAAAANGALWGSWEAEVAQLHIRLTALRAQVQQLLQYEEEFSADVEVLQEQEMTNLEKMESVRDKLEEDEQLNFLLGSAASDALELFAALTAQQAQVQQLLQQLLTPCGVSATRAASAGQDQVQHEVQVVSGLPVTELAVPQQLRAGGTHAAGKAGPTSSSNSSSSNNPVLMQSTVSRLQLAGQQLLVSSRTTTGGKARTAAAAHPDRRAAAATGVLPGLPGLDMPMYAGSSSSHGDTAAAAALRGAAALDAVAAARCPAALLMRVAEHHKQLRQLQQRLSGLSGASTAIAASSSTAKACEGQMQEQVAQLHDSVRHQTLPRLQLLLEDAQQTRVFIKEELLPDIGYFWEMPAQHLVPHRTYQGKDCSQWLLELQSLMAQKRELSSQT